ncbi:MAG: DUF3854 domain-containing protein [Sphaerospermopsis sp. SIO1G1]|nr:DUF3854 domain-containing protein [Sphaerospermopsis sp. SIO1G1]
MSTIITEKTTNLVEELPKNRFNSLYEFQEFVENKFINESTIEPTLLKACIEFHEDIEATPWGDVETPIHDELGWKYIRFGMKVKETLYAAFLKNEDGTTWQTILSIWDEERQRPYKYYAPKEIGDRAFLPPIPDKIRKLIGSKYGVKVPTVKEGSFWEWVKTQNTIPKILTEGAGKGLSQLSLGYVAIALYGCNCGGRVGKNGLIDDLRQFNTEESIWLFGLDRDEKEKTKRRVNSAKRQLKLTLESDGAKFYIEDIFWNHEDGKGADDLIANKGAGAFDAAYHAAMVRLEKQFKNGGYSSDDDKEFKPTELKIARRLAEKYREIFAYNDEISSWMRYAQEKPGVWFEESNDYFRSVVYKLLLSEGCKGFKAAFVNNVADILKYELILREWGEKSPTEILPFKNGVYNAETKQLEEHSPGYRLTWQLPRNYEPDGTWENIDKYLNHLSNNNPKMKDILICYCNAVLKGRSDLQKCLYLIGHPGTGKGTYLRLLSSMVGEENIHSTKLEIFCTDKFDVGNARGKRLVMFSDQAQYSGSVGEFLSLTGQDELRGEKKNKNAKPFIYDGMAAIAANDPVFVGKVLNAVYRRLIQFPCNNLVPPELKQDLGPIFEPEIGAFTAYCLGLPDDHVTKVLDGANKVTDTAVESWENRIQSDSLASWINYELIADPNAKTQIGNDKDEYKKGVVATLFGSYREFCDKTGRTGGRGNDVFSSELEKLCRVIDWPVKLKKTNKGRFFFGVRLRQKGLDDHIPSYDIYLENQKVTDGDGQSDGQSDGLEPLYSKESDGGDGLNPKSSENLKPESDENEISTEIVHPPKTTLEFKIGDFVWAEKRIGRIKTLADHYCTLSDNSAHLLKDIEPVDIQSNVELIRECVSDKNWDMVTDLTEGWPSDFKSEIWSHLSDAEKKNLQQLKPETSKKKTESTEAIALENHSSKNSIILLQEKGKYLSKSMNRKIKIFMIYDNDKECSCTIEGMKGTYTRPFSDILPLPDSPKMEVKEGDRVKVTDGKYKGETGRIRSVDSDNQGVFITFNSRKKTYKPFFAHEITKLN